MSQTLTLHRSEGSPLTLWLLAMTPTHDVSKKLYQKAMKQVLETKGKIDKASSEHRVYWAFDNISVIELGKKDAATPIDYVYKSDSGLHIELKRFVHSSYFCPDDPEHGFLQFQPGSLRFGTTRISWHGSDAVFSAFWADFSRVVNNSLQMPQTSTYQSLAVIDKGWKVEWASWAEGKDVDNNNTSNMRFDSSNKEYVDIALVRVYWPKDATDANLREFQLRWMDKMVDLFVVGIGQYMTRHVVGSLKEAQQKLM